MDVWKEIRRFAESRAPMAIETSLLGKVDWVVDPDGSTRSIIPQWVIDEADKNDMDVMSADWRRGAYTLKLRPNVELSGACKASART